MAERLENYDNVFDNDQLSFTFFDAGTADNDRIDVLLNGQIVADNLELTNTGTTVELPALTTGANTLTVTSLNAGTISTSNQVGISVPEDSNLYGETTYTPTLTQGESFSIEIGLPKVRIDGSQAPFAAQNILDTLDNPVKLTLERLGTNDKKRKKRSKNNTEAYTQELGAAPNQFERDEVPPAATIESGDNSSIPKNVRAIPLSDNRKGGEIIGDFINTYGPNNIQLEDGSVIDYYATEPNYETGVTGIVPIYGTNGNDDELFGTRGTDNLIYGFDGNDTLRGSPVSYNAVDISDIIDNVDRSGKDTLIGGRGDDVISGRADSDILVGQSGEDRLFGNVGNDVVYGGPGFDLLYGDIRDFDPVISRLASLGKDKFVLGRNEGTDLIKDFDVDRDLIHLLDPTNFSTLQLTQITDGKRPDGSQVVFPLPTFEGGISNGTEISLKRGKFAGQVLAYLDNVSASSLDRDSFVAGNSKAILPSPIE